MKLIITLFSLIISTYSLAGSMKELSIEAQDAIVREMLSFDKQVISIYNAEFKTYGNQIEYYAEVTVQSFPNGFNEKFKCKVELTKEENSFFSTNVECK